MRHAHHSICRACTASCPVVVQVENGTVVGVDADKTGTGARVYHGYACKKGRGVPEFMNSPSRLMHSVKRDSRGNYRAIGSAEAISEVADRLGEIKSRHGFRSIALYTGTFAFNHSLSGVMARAWMDGMGLPMQFSTATIDQPGKGVAASVHGTWMAGPPTDRDADVFLYIGVNPAISMQGPPNPAYAIAQARKRGAKIIVVDPRRTEIASLADVFLQAHPRSDVFILAGLIRVIVKEKLFDAAFIGEHARGFKRLTDAVEPFEPREVCRRAGLSEELLLEAARTYAGGRRGIVLLGTGPNMAGYGTLIEYLGRCLMSMCGHWRRAGDVLHNTGVLVQRLPQRAQAADPQPGWGLGEHEMRFHGLKASTWGLPTAFLPDEILTPGEGQIRALIVQGGNPIMAFPDQLKTYRALRALEFLVVVDPEMSETARLADYVLAPKTHFETHGETGAMEFSNAFPGLGLQHAFAYVCPPIVDPPSGSDLLEDWEFYYGMAQRLGVQLEIKPSSLIYYPERQREFTSRLDMETKPATKDLLSMLFRESPVQFDVIAATPDGYLTDGPPAIVGEKERAWTGRLDMGNELLLGTLDDAFDDNDEFEGFPLRLISRRLKDRYNSNWRSHSVSRREWSHNPAFMHPADLVKFDLRDGDLIEISSPHAAIKGVVEAARDVREGNISMSHCWGNSPGEDEDPILLGANTGKLVDNEKEIEPWTGIPRMSAIPVNVKLIRRASLVG